MSRISAITPHVRRMATKGWSVESIAHSYRVATADVRAILRPRLPRPPFSRPSPQPKPVDPWKGPPGDWRFRDEVGDPVTETSVVAQICATELPDQAAAAAITAELVKPKLSTWSGPSSPCQTSLHGGRRRIKD